MKYLLLLISFGFSFPVYSITNDPMYSRQTAVLSSLFDQLVKHQINPENAIEKSISALLKSYPEQIESVLTIAITKYPHNFKQIMCGALRAEPALTSDVIDIILKSNIASSEEVINFALIEEPAYATEIVNAAVSHNPLDIENIVRVAIIAEPLMAKHIVDATMMSYPEKILDILAVAIKALPDQVVNLVRDTLRISPENPDIVSIAIHSSNGGNAREIISMAIKSGISEASATQAAIDGGAKQTDITKIK